MKYGKIRKLWAVTAVALLISLAGCATGSYPAQPDLSATAATAEGTAAQPEHTQPTQGAPAETLPPVTAAPTAPPETEPAVTEFAATEPAVTEPKATEPPVTVPPATQPPETQPAPTTPQATEPVQVEYESGNHYVHILNYTPGPEEHGHVYWCSEGTGKFYKGEYSFDVDYKTITYDIWCSWGPVVQMAFRTAQTCSCSTDHKMTPEEAYYFNRITEYENYTCGFENHYCASQGGHDRLMREIADGCYFCGRSDCVSFYARNEQGLTQQDKYLCAEYDVHRDPWFYCQICNMPTWQTIQDVTKCCFGYVHDTNCHYCGLWVGAEDCHTCKQEDIDAFQGG